MKRALVLAGGGAKIGWASGALQVLLEEGGLRFLASDRDVGCAGFGDAADDRTVDWRTAFHAAADRNAQLRQ